MHLNWSLESRTRTLALALGFTTALLTRATEAVLATNIPALPPPPPPPPAITLEDVTLTGELQGDQTRFTLTATAKVDANRGGTLDLLTGRVALIEVAEHARWRIRIEEGRHVLVADRDGKYPIRLVFGAAVRDAESWKSVDFHLAPAPLQKIVLRGLAAETQFQFPGAAKPERAGTDFVSYLPATGDVKLAWKEARAETEGKLFYAAEALSQITVSPGLLRQSTLFDFKVLQGELAQITLRLRGSGEVTRVQGAPVLSWTVEPGADAADRRLIIRLNQPQKDAFALSVQLQAPLGAFPQTLDAPQLQPDSATRFAGHTRVVNDGAVRLEVLQAGGLSQVSPEQFPLTDAFKALGLAGGTQVFAYRFSGAAFDLRIQADNILPELGVSEILLYHLGETELSIDGEFELDIREAPLRELLLHLPRGFALAKINASGMSDYFVTEGTDDAPTLLRIVYGAPAAGRQVLQLRLERNAPWRDPAWPLPRIEVARAKSTRGHVGVIADAGFRLAPATTQGLTDIATAFFPKKLAGLQAAFRLSDPAWQATLNVERLAQSIQVDAFHLFSVGEGIAYGSSVLNYVISGAPVSMFKVELSAEYFNVEFTGKEIRNWQLVEGAYQVQLHTPVSGAYTLLATYERPFKAAGETLGFAGARPLDAQSEQGHTLVISAYQFQVQPANVSSNLLALEPGEVPAAYRLFFDAPVLAAYRYTARPFNLELQLQPLAQGETINQVVDRAAFITRISEEGQILTEARYLVKSKGAPYFRITLPADSELWSATVNGNAVVPVAEAKAHLIPLPPRADPDSVQTIELKIAGRSANARHLPVTLPAAAAPVLLAEWRLTPDTGQRLAQEGGALTVVGGQVDGSGWGGLLRMFQAGVSGETRARPVIALIAVLLALFMGHLIDRQEVYRGSLAHLGGGALALFAFCIGAWQLGRFADDARAFGVALGNDLSFLIPVQQAGSAPTLTLANLPLETSRWEYLGRYWPAALTIVLWLWSWIRAEGLLAALGRALGWAILVWTALRTPNGAPAAILVVLAFVLLQLVIPAVRRLWQRPPRPVPDTETGNASATATAMLLLAAALAGSGLTQAHADPVVLPPVAELVQHQIRVQDEFVTGTATIRWEARRDQKLPLLLEPAVLTGIQFPERLLELLPVEDLGNGRRAYSVRARRNGTAEIQLNYQARVTQREGQSGFLLPVQPGVVNRATITLAGIEADWAVPQAVTLRPSNTATNAASSNLTVAELVLAPAPDTWIGWKPRSRDTRLEKAVFYVDIQQLVIPAAGTLEVSYYLQVRPAQGEIAELFCDVPPGITITDVTARGLSVWRFDPDTRKLRLAFATPQARPVGLLVQAQIPTGPLPYERTVETLAVNHAAGQLGLAGVATGNEVQLDDVTGQGVAPINLEDFPAAVLESARTRVAGLALRRAFRFSDRTGSLTLKAAAVEPDVRVESQQTLSLGEDRTVLAANLTVDITRAGIFRLSFLLPPALDVESISGQALSHWTELKSDTDRLITLHLRGKTEGRQTLAVSLSGPGLRGVTNWAVPRFALREANKQQGQLVVVPEQGMRLQVADRDGLTQLDPARSGIRQKGVLAFRLLQDPWRLALNVEQVDAWIQVNSLQAAAVSDGQLRVTANLNYEIENTGVKTLSVRLPANAESVRFQGEHLADFLKREGATNTATQDWEVKLQRRILGRYNLQVTYQILTPGQPDQVQLAGIQALDANLQRGFVTVRSEGRLQLRIDAAPAALQPAEWQSIPRLLQGDLASAAANFTYRLVEPDFQLPVQLERREAAKLLPARVQNVTLTSVVSEDGVMLTQARVQLTAGDKRLLHLTLPPNARFWFAFVNQSSVWPWREKDQLLLPLDSPSKGSAVAVEFFYTLPTPRAGGRTLDLSLAGPKFDLPLENITWNVFLNARWQVRHTTGTLTLQREQPVALPTAIDFDSYIRRESSLQQQKLQVAEQMIGRGNDFLQKGDPQEARRAFQAAYGLSQHDNAFNEDARVQLHNLKMQQALVGLNARQAAVAGDAAAPAAQLQAPAGTGAPNYTQEQAKQILDRNSAEDNAVQLRLAERLVQQQDAAVPNPAAIRATIPEQGRLLTFSRSLLVDRWADLKVGIQASAPPAVSLSRRIALLAGLVIALTVLVRLAQKRPAAP